MNIIVWHLIRKEYWLFPPPFSQKYLWSLHTCHFIFKFPIHSKNPRYVIRIMSLELNAVHHNDHRSVLPLLFPPSLLFFSSFSFSSKKESSSLTRSISWCLIVPRRSINTSVRKRRKKERGGRERERERERDLYSKTLNGTLKKRKKKKKLRRRRKFTPTKRDSYWRRLRDDDDDALLLLLLRQREEKTRRDTERRRPTSFFRSSRFRNGRRFTRRECRQHHRSF